MPSVHAISDIVGTSETSISEAIQVAIAKANETLRNLEWFEVVEVRGGIDGGKVASYQVTLKVGFKYDK